VVALGDFVRPAPLVGFLLELCESDLRLAHKTHWFLKSFCADGGGSPPLLSGLSSFALRVQKRGCAVASRLARGLGAAVFGRGSGSGGGRRRSSVRRSHRPRRCCGCPDGRILSGCCWCQARLSW
ncbi:unnamed protein product, partial [Ectocarpus sp. 12 AP-2014]